MKSNQVYIFVIPFVFFFGIFVGYTFLTKIEMLVALSGSDNYNLVKDGYIPDEKTLIKIAKAVWIPIYGDKSFIWYKYNIKLDDKGTWIIECSNIFSNILPVFGGGPYMRIDGNRGTILEVSHTK